MEVPPGYVYDLSKRRAEMHFPSLKLGENADYTSLKGDHCNCAAWAAEIDNEWKQFKDEHGNLDLRPETYINYFETFGFKLTDNLDFQDGVVKIAIYTDQNNEFKHVARQLPDGKWTSKIGDWEDIWHETPELLKGKSYGCPSIFMKK